MNRALPAIAVAVFGLSILLPALPAFGVTYTDYVQAGNPIGYWRLGDTGSGDGTTALDSSTAGADLTYHGGVSLGEEGIPGSVGDSAAGMNGSTTYVRDAVWGRFVPDAATINFWFKPTSPGGTQYLVSSMGANDFHGCCWRWHTETSGNRTRFQLYDGDADAYGAILSDDSFVTGEWNHLVITYDVGDKANMWLNGVHQTQQLDISSATDWGYLQMGARLYKSSSESDPPHNLFSGLLDEVAIYDRVLGDDEIDHIYALGIAPEPSTLVLLVGAFLGLTFFAWRRRRG